MVIRHIMGEFQFADVEQRRQLIDMFSQTDELLDMFPQTDEKESSLGVSMHVGAVLSISV